LSQTYDARGDLGEAERWIWKAIEIAERLDDQPKLAIDYNNPSQIYQPRGDLGEAERWIRKAIEIAEGLDDQPKLAIYSNNLSQIYKARGDLGEANGSSGSHRNRRAADDPTILRRLQNAEHQAAGLGKPNAGIGKAIEIERLTIQQAHRYIEIPETVPSAGQMMSGFAEKRGSDPSRVSQFARPLPGSSLVKLFGLNQACRRLGKEAGAGEPHRARLARRQGVAPTRL
jgi:tetratricopeptide (TPR) repeat protein